MSNIEEIQDVELLDQEIERLQYDRENAISMVDEDILFEKIDLLNNRREQVLRDID